MLVTFIGPLLDITVAEEVGVMIVVIESDMVTGWAELIDDSEPGEKTAEEAIQGAAKDSDTSREVTEGVAEAEVVVESSARILGIVTSSPPETGPIG